MKMATTRESACLLSICFVFIPSLSDAFVPIVLTTWPYREAVSAGWEKAISDKPTAFLDAVEATGTTCEFLQCRHTVGFGGSPDENGETTLDAMIMDGVTHNVGAVGGIRRIKNAIGVARKVLDNTNHTLLVGDSATEFAKTMGFKEESLTTNYSTDLWKKWKAVNCQPNFWLNVTPDPRQSCGPYSPIHSKKSTNSASIKNEIGADNHDTIGIMAIDKFGNIGAGASTNGLTYKIPGYEIGADNHDTICIMAIDKFGNIAAGASTNGLTYKIPGRVGDSPIMGAGAYADTDIGAAACTGDGDKMMRFLPSFQTVALMSTGMSPEEAATQVINIIQSKYPDFKGAIVAVNKEGKFGAACHVWTNFAITVRDSTMSDVQVLNVTCH